MEKTNTLIPIASMNCDELLSALDLQQKFRAKQIFKWIADGASSFGEMTNLPLDLRISLSEKAVIFSSKITQKLVDTDGTVKLQLTMNDGCCIETVLLIDGKSRKTACVSCQAGCGMKCAFCKTGTLGIKRNLTSYEIVEEFLHLEKECGKLDNIVFMGMGEPLCNLTEIRKAISILCDENGRNLSAKRITVSTCGIVNGIYDLADNGPKVRLAISLTTANEELRQELMPVTKTNPLAKLKPAIAYFIEKSGKRCTLEVALIGNKNTNRDSAHRLIEFAKDLNVHINLIPWNYVEGLNFCEPTKKECEYFYEMLKNANLNVTFRMKKGEKIGGACGQLGKV